MENELNQDLELEQIESEQDTEENLDVEESDVDYKSLYEHEKQKATKLKRKLFSKEAESNDKPINNRPSEDKWKTKMELKVEGYDDDAVDFILKNGGKKALENPYVTAAIAEMKVKKAAETAAISQDSSKSQIEKRFTPGEFAKLSHDEQLKAMSDLK